MKKLNYSAIFSSKNVLAYITILFFALRFIIDHYQLEYLLMVKVFGGLTIWYMLHFFYKKKEYNFITIFTAAILVLGTKLSLDVDIASSEKRDWERIQQHFEQNKDTLTAKEIQL